MKICKVCVMIITFISASISSKAFAQPSSQADINYLLGTKGLISAEVQIKTIRTEKVKVIVLFLPFIGKEIIPDNTKLIGLAHYKDHSVVTVIIPGNKTNISFKCSIEMGKQTKHRLRIAQFGLGSTLIIPTIDNRIIQRFKYLEESDSVELISKYNAVKAEADAGFTIIESRGEFLLHEPTTIPIAFNSQRGTYELTFRQPSSILDEALKAITTRIILVILGILLALMAPGYIPESYLLRAYALISGLLVIFLMIRWILTIRSRSSFIPALTDTVASIVYTIILLLCVSLRRKQQQ